MTQDEAEGKSLGKPAFCKPRHVTPLRSRCSTAAVSSGARDRIDFPNMESASQGDLSEQTSRFGRGVSLSTVRCRAELGAFPTTCLAGPTSSDLDRTIIETGPARSSFRNGDWSRTGSGGRNDECNCAAAAE